MFNMFSDDALSNILACAIIVLWVSVLIIFLVSFFMFLIPISKYREKLSRDRKYIKSIGGDVSSYKPSYRPPLVSWNCIALYCSAWPLMILSYILVCVCDFYNLISDETFEQLHAFVVPIEFTSVGFAFVILICMIVYSFYSVSITDKK